MTEGTVKVSQDIIDLARSAKAFIRESGEEALPDESLLRAAVAFNMLQRQGFIVTARAVEGCGSHEVDGFDRSFAVATIAHNFTDHPPSTSEREALFSAELHLPDFLRAAVAANRRALGLPPQCQVCDAIGCTEHEVSPEHEVSRA